MKATELNEYVATLVDYVEENWAAFQLWLRISACPYDENKLEALHAELRKRAGRE